MKKPTIKANDLREQGLLTEFINFLEVLPKDTQAAQMYWSKDADILSESKGPEATTVDT